MPRTAYAFMGFVINGQGYYSCGGRGLREDVAQAYNTNEAMDSKIGLVTRASQYPSRSSNAGFLL